MTTPNRYLRFQTIDLDQPCIRAYCSRCEMEFAPEPAAGDSFEDLLWRARAQFDVHQCQDS